MGAKRQREARRIAFANAKRVKLFNQGKQSLYSKLGIRLRAFFSKESKARYEKMLGWWYKRALKKEAHYQVAVSRDPDVKAFKATRRKLRKEYIAKKGAIRG